MESCKIREDLDQNDILVLDWSDLDDDIVAADNEDDDDVDDGIKVIIDVDQKLTEKEELRRIHDVISESDSYTNQEIDDLAVKSELEKLVAKSISPRNSRCITVKFRRQIILIPSDTPISSRLASLLWPYPKSYTPMKLPSQNEFDKNLIECRQRGHFWLKSYPHDIPVTSKIGIFAAKYKKNVITLDLPNNASSSVAKNDDGFRHCSSGVYQYCDFALIIIENGTVIDYAIHGVQSNIAECIAHHKPKKIFYNAKKNDALDVFLHYEYQPFYNSMYGLMEPLQIDRLPENFNPISFCERNDVYCALCSALRDLRGLLFQVPDQQLNTTEFANKRPMHRQNRWKMAKNQYGQPLHNANRIYLRKVEKTQTRFRPYNRQHDRKK
ncbi:GrBNV gp78-like protein [Tomelloso virus]|uniref:GrBNV gp78-like protein n=1 Tax=Tomelloso virus TaxID=2053981 RepID=A0A2H4T2Q3_9VIRU|nr:GrBNV gp78-like protein [Tomelloso virus]ATY70203.1 GrBNV gp78-like protein [Tomelloso virus]